MLAVGCRSGQVCVYDITADELVFSTVPHGGPGKDDAAGISILTLAPDGHSIAESGKDAPIRIWDLRSKELIGELPCKGLPEAVAFSPDGTCLAVANRATCCGLGHYQAVRKV